MIKAAIVINWGIIGFQTHICKLKCAAIGGYPVILLTTMLNTQKLFRLQIVSRSSADSGHHAPSTKDTQCP
jgi:hypothetical protein